ncbi:MAG: 1-(5-phosphoribosyl)-5-[(5-phosphoribosylamino)methylideneamino]imidazole-4-carboxamide isomerase [Anaeroplasmataceae bacterium]
MKLYPAIDLHDGQAVRLYKGDYDKVTVFGKPLDMAKKWASMGATFLHLVDLDGAKDGESKNLEAVKEIIDNVCIDVELGGGIRSIERIKEILDMGVKRVILGSIALKNPSLVKEAISLYGPEKIVVGVDCKNFMVATEGWLCESNVDALTFCHTLEEAGVKYVIFTDIAKDGTLSGVNIEQTKKLVDNTSLQIIASGGVHTMDDIKAVSDIGCYGVILGKSIYMGTIDLSLAVKKFGC